jgi:hypothetical protein
LNAILYKILAVLTIDTRAPVTIASQRI